MVSLSEYLTSTQYKDPEEANLAWLLAGMPAEMRQMALRGWQLPSIPGIQGPEIDLGTTAPEIPGIGGVPINQPVGVSPSPAITNPNFGMPALPPTNLPPVSIQPPSGIGITPNLPGGGISNLPQLPVNLPGIEGRLPSVSLPQLPNIPGLTPPPISGIGLPNLPGLNLPNLNIPGINLPKLPISSPLPSVGGIPIGIPGFTPPNLPIDLGGINIPTPIGTIGLPIGKLPTYTPPNIGAMLPAPVQAVAGTIGAIVKDIMTIANPIMTLVNVAQLGNALIEFMNAPKRQQYMNDRQKEAGLIAEDKTAVRDYFRLSNIGYGYDKSFGNKLADANLMKFMSKDPTNFRYAVEQTGGWVERDKQGGVTKNGWQLLTDRIRNEFGNDVATALQKSYDDMHDKTLYNGKMVNIGWKDFTTEVGWKKYQEEQTKPSPAIPPKPSPAIPQTDPNRLAEWQARAAREGGQLVHTYGPNYVYVSPTGPINLSLVIERSKSSTL